MDCEYGGVVIIIWGLWLAMIPVAVACGDWVGRLVGRAGSVLPAGWFIVVEGCSCGRRQTLCR
jgi:hypothetical protein